MSTHSPASLDIEAPVNLPHPPPDLRAPAPRRRLLRPVLSALSSAAARLGWRLNLILLVATFFSTTLCGGLLFWNTAGMTAGDLPGALRTFLAPGVGYALLVMLILGSHEMGHYVLCRMHGVRASLPYFIPAPPPVMFGTFGAVIRMRPPIPGRRALFDIGIAGPIAGFLLSVPVLAYGISTAAVEEIPRGPALFFNDPFLIEILSSVLRGPIPEGSSLVLNPALLAGWVGLLVTAMNLFPVGQLDGGHVAYALSGRLHAAFSLLTVGGMIGLVAFTALRGVLTPWLLWTLLLIFIGRFPHPPVLDESEPLGPARTALGLAAPIMFALCFIPVPMEFTSGAG